MKQRLIASALFVLFAFIAPAHAQSIFQADSKINVTSTIAANNVSPVVISLNPSSVYSIDGFNNSTTLAYIKLYNTGTAVCGSGRPIARYMIPFGTSSSGGGFNISNINGDAFAFGITMCITTGIADNDTGSPAASTYIVNLHWKPVEP